MPRKIYSQTLRRAKPTIEKSPNEQTPNSWHKIKDFVVTLGATTGILAGVLWMGGRFYAYGYFERMNIPLYFLSFSTAEYAETYVTSIVGNIFTYISSRFQTLPIAIALIIAIALTLWLIQKHYTKLKIREAIAKIEEVNNRLLVIGFIALFLLSFLQAYKNGADAAEYIMENSQSITIYSKDLLPLKTPSIINVSNERSPLYEYTDFYLLTYNNGKYYFFREFDLENCKPKQVYIIKDNDTISVNIENNSTPLQCSATP